MLGNGSTAIAAVRRLMQIFQHVGMAKNTLSDQSPLELSRVGSRYRQKSVRSRTGVRDRGSKGLLASARGVWPADDPRPAVTGALKRRPSVPRSGETVARTGLDLGQD
jgi:hypothetical protein